MFQYVILMEQNGADIKEEFPYSLPHDTIYFCLLYAYICACYINVYYYVLYHFFFFNVDGVYKPDPNMAFSWSVSA